MSEAPIKPKSPIEDSHPIAWADSDDCLIVCTDCLLDSTHATARQVRQAVLRNGLDQQLQLSVVYAWPMFRTGDDCGQLCEVCEKDITPCTGNPSDHPCTLYGALLRKVASCLDDLVAFLKDPVDHDAPAMHVELIKRSDAFPSGATRDRGVYHPQPACPGTRMMAYNDLGDPGNDACWHTGKKCIEDGCAEPAGTAWSPFWCFKHNVERIDRLSRFFKKLGVGSEC